MTYTDNVAVKASTVIGSNFNVLLTGPNGFTQTPISALTTPNADANQITVS